MAKTPLLSSLRSLWVDLHRSRRTGIPLDELRSMRALHRSLAPRPSRRQLLVGGAALAGVAALPLPARGQNRRGPSIGIVGGGIAGLNCALTLADAGVDATVYEASGRVGGRMFSNRDYFADGQVTEWGGELIDSGHETVQALAERYDLPLDDLLAAQPEGSSDTYFVNGEYYSKEQADADFAEIFDAVVADEASAPFPTLFDSFTPEGQALDAMSVYDYIESRVPGGHRSPLGQVLDLAYAIEYGADTRRQSALNILYLLAFQPSEDELSLFGESDEQFHIRGGNQRLPEAIAADLGDRVRNGQRLTRIEQTASGRYRLTLEQGGTSREVTHDFVVLAVPFAVLSEVDFSRAGFDALKRRAIREQGRGHNGKLQLQFERRRWLGDGPWPGISNGSSYSETGYQASWEATRAQRGRAGVLVLFSGGSVTDAMRTDRAFATIQDNGVRRDAQRGLEQLAPVYPSLQFNGRATQSLPHLSPLFRASYSFYSVGQYIAFAGYEKVRQGGVLFCGEHTSTDFQGFMEGGATEGARAGEELLELLGINAVRRRRRTG
ncbi:MAG TPA: NAD(P)/FAD-dependent oxidoreductase [Polyangiaceae bacterium]|nr:NAD(P)/FAD-dependent oxidoreductase [Polyangiaceae bacterium]